MKRFGSYGFFYILFFVYEEILLRVVSGRGMYPFPEYILLLCIGGGLLASLFTMLFGRFRSIAGAVLMIPVSIWYVLQSRIEHTYQVYMPLTTIMGETGNVMTGYGDVFLRAVLYALPYVLLFFLPELFYLFVLRRPFRKMKVQPRGIVLFFVFILFSLGTFAILKYVTRSESSRFDFDKSVNDTGLIYASLQSARLDLFGNDAASFVIEDMPAEEPAVPEEPEPTPAESIPESAEEIVETPIPVEYKPHVMDLNFARAVDQGGRDIPALNEYIKSLTPYKENEYTGLFKGKNLILICAEAFTDTFVDPELTPTLYRLEHEGFYFSNFYQPAWGGSTTSGESSFLLGLIPQQAGSSMKITAGNNNYFTLGNALQREGYSSAAFHAGQYEYYRRDTTHANLGYDHYYASENGVASLTGIQYPKDTVLLDKTADLYLDKEPFSIYYMTISGHAGYYKNNAFVDQYYDRVNEVYPDQYAEKTKYYICYQMELEESLRILVEKLEAAGIADNTVICMTGDHYPYGLEYSSSWGNDRNYIDDLIGKENYAPYEKDTNGLVLWCGSLENEDKDMWKEISDPVTTIDVVPTLLNLFGITFDSRLLPGRDAFSDTEPLAMWNDGTWITSLGVYNGQSRRFTPLTDQPIPDEDAYVQKISSIVDNKMLLSRTIVEQDYYGLLFGEDEITEAGTPITIPES